MINHRQGFSLIELLLVLVCMAAILSWTMHHYQQHQRRAQMMQVQSDIKSWQNALDNYFHRTGCNQNGVFSGSSADVVDIDCATLQGSGDIICNRAPLITQYAAQLIKTDQTTADTAKPIYQLRVRAIFATTLTPGQMAWYQQELHAKAGTNSAMLVWDSLPTVTNVQPGDKSWVINGSGAFFRATENKRTPADDTSPDSSGSFCAH